LEELASEEEEKRPDAAGAQVEMGVGQPEMSAAQPEAHAAQAVMSEAAEPGEDQLIVRDIFFGRDQ